MIKEITVAGIKLNNYSALEKLAQVEKNLAENTFTAIEDIYMRTILLAKEDEVVKSVIESLGITAIADAEILDAVGANTIFMQKEVDTKAFFSQLMKRVERSNMTVYVVGENEKEAEAAVEYFAEEFPRIKLMGYAVLDENIATHEDIINQMNMIAPEVVISVLPSPAQEHFLADHRGMISAKIWYGLGSGKIAGHKRGIVTAFWKRFRQHKLKKYIELDKEQSNL